MRGTLTFNEPLAPHTSWRIGGLADKYYRPDSIEDLAEFLSMVSPEEPITWLGLGSNVLVADEGVRGVVVHTLPSPLPLAGEGARRVGEGRALSFIEDQNNTKEKKIIRAEAGITCAKLAKFCAKHGLIGGEFFAGIPGTVGGALAMNAGAWGGETWQQVVSVEVINRQGERVLRSPNQYQIGYRSVHGPKEEWFIAGHFQFECGNSEDATFKIKELLRQRNATQPTGVFSCGSVFKNPQDHHAGQLIEASKLKGFTIGGAQISPKHANFILNLGSATAKDVFQLIKHVQNMIVQDHQIYLEPEVRFLGFV